MDASREPEFARALAEVLDLYGQSPSPTAIGLWWSALEDLPFEAVTGALSEYIRRGKYPPKPADVLEIIENRIRECWPTADEAWAQAQAAADERATVVWTEEASRAYHEAARPLLAEGDKVAARRAFVDRYERELRAGLAARRRPTPLVSEGWDRTSRQGAVEAAVHAGRLSQSQARPYLLRYEQDEVTEDGAAIAGLLTGQMARGSSSEVVRRLRAVRAAIRPGTERDGPAERRRRADQRMAESKVRAKAALAQRGPV
ncbi:MAG: hypothetical protein ACOC00_05715 [Halothiobacillaceae bacterium]